MKALVLSPFQFRRWMETCLTSLTLCFATGPAATHAAQSSVRPLQQAKWSAGPKGQDAHDVKVVGNYAYVASGSAGLAVFDVSNPTNPLPVANCDTLGGAYQVVVSGRYAYVANGDGLQVIDVSNPVRCVRVGGYYGRAGLNLAVSGNYAYMLYAVQDGAGSWRFPGFHLIDVSDPTNCVQVGSFDFNGGVRGIAVSGNYAYVAKYSWTSSNSLGGLLIIDVSNPTKCVLAGGYDIIGNTESVAVSGNNAYVSEVRWTGSNYLAGMHVIDVSNPTNCVRIGGVESGWGDVVVSGSYAYVLDGPGFSVIDVSDPTNCVRLGACDIATTSWYGEGLAVSGNHAYVAVPGWGLQVFDVSDPTDCVKVMSGDSPRGFTTAVAVSGNYAYVAEAAGSPDGYPVGGGFHVIGVRDPSNLVRVGGVAALRYAQDVALAGNYAYVVNGDAGLEIINVSDPTNCVRVGGYRSSLSDHAIVALEVSGTYAYSLVRYVERWGCGDAGRARWEYSVHVIDVRNPTNCVEVAILPTVAVPVDVAVSGNYTYVAEARKVVGGCINVSGGLRVFDVSNPANPVSVGGYDADGNGCSAVAVSGNYAYATWSRWTESDYTGGLHVIDVSDPTNCVKVGSFETDGEAIDVAVSGNRVYLVEGPRWTGSNYVGGGVHVIDVSNPTNCVRVGGYDPGGWALGVTVADGRIYVADAEDGLLVLPTLPNVQFTVRVDATPGVPFTLEASTDLAVPYRWKPLLTTNVSAMPFDFVDYDVKLSDKPQKFYRVRQP